MSRLSDRPQNRRRKEVCLRGHEILGVRANGQRFCLECSKVRSHKWYDSKVRPINDELDRKALTDWPQEWGAR